MRVVVTGSRRAQRWAVEGHLNRLRGGVTHLATGASPSGTDAHTKRWARRNEVPCVEYPADWERYGRPGGPLRNREMLDAEKPDLVLAFPLIGGRLKSRGTWDCIEAAVERGINVQIYPVPKEEP